MKILFTLFTLLAALAAPAQTLKWSFPTFASAWSTDGRGGLAVISSADFTLGTVIWLEPNGRALFTNHIADLGANGAGSSVRIVRFTRAELVVQVEASYEYAPGTNFIRRFRPNGTFTDTVLPVGEQMDAQFSQLADKRGYFTREAAPPGVIFRRYSN